MRYFVVEPLDDGTFQVWRVQLSRLGQHEEPDEDGVVVDVTGARWSWCWHAVGEPITGTIERAKAEAYKFWY